MLDLKLLQRSPEVVAKALADRGSSLDMAEFTALDERRRALLAEVEALKGERNKASGEVARMKRAGEDAAPLLERLSALSDRIKDLDRETEEVKAAVNDWLLAVPNIPDASVPLPSPSPRRNTGRSAPPLAGWISSARASWRAAALPCTAPGRPGWSAPWPTSS